MFTGYPLGIVLGAILSMFMLEDFGWRIMFGIGMIPLLLIPFIIRYLPESIQFLLSRNRQEEVNQILNRFQIEFHVKIKLIKLHPLYERKMDFYFILKRIHKSNTTFGSLI